jgi:hypothetical protein
MAIEDPLACLARADLALEKGDRGRDRWWRGLAEALRVSPSVQRAFAQCRTLSQLGDQLRRRRSEALCSNVRATLETHGWLCRLEHAMEALLYLTGTERWPPPALRRLRAEIEALRPYWGPSVTKEQAVAAFLAAREKASSA